MIKNLIISLVIAVAAHISIVIIHEALASNIVPYLSFLVLFIGVFIATLVSGRAGGAKTFRPGAASGSAPASNSDSETGTVKWFNVKKGYGFITRDQGDDIFVHYRNIIGKGRRAINEGQRVSFIVIDGDKGLQADEVEPLEG